ncbi:MAG: hypothetical protein KDE27_25985 [Planctomycetes bacterium]|nr:hypothetical protein [Planctomycetota bacterium]
MRAADRFVMSGRVARRVVQGKNAAIGHLRRANAPSASSPVTTGPEFAPMRLKARAYSPVGRGEFATIGPSARGLTEQRQQQGRGGKVSEARDLVMPLSRSATSDRFEGLALRESGGRVVLPTDAEWERALARCVGSDDLIELDRSASAMRDLVRRRLLTKRDVAAVVEWQLRVRRRLGDVLARTVRRGGDRSANGGKANQYGLPAGVDKHVSLRCRRLAAIPVAVFDEYLSVVRRDCSSPSEAGAIAFAKASGVGLAATPKTRSGDPDAMALRLSAALRDAAQRLLGRIDVLVGSTSLTCGRRVAASTVKAGDLSGVVFVADCLDPSTWLPKLARLRLDRAVEQVLVAMPARTHAGWFAQLAENDWHTCFVRGGQSSVMAVYHGARYEAFYATFASIGVVMRCHRP